MAEIVMPATPGAAWPELSFEGWRETYATLHRWIQIVGKTRLACAPMQNHWWQVVLYITTRGVGTSPMPFRDRSFDVEFDFVDHVLRVQTDDGQSRAMPLVARSVADFHREYRSLLAALDIQPRIWPVPMELSDTLRFDEDHLHASYDPDAAHRCWRALAETDRVFKTYRGAYLGKSSPSHFWWGGFDLACTRFSGRRAPQHGGGIPNCPDFVTIEAYSHECMSVGWWPGSAGVMEAPAYYAYVYPEPPGYSTARIAPEGAYYHEVLREWILPYEAVRSASDPDAAILQFCETTYAAAASLATWDRGALERPVPWTSPAGRH